MVRLSLLLCFISAFLITGCSESGDLSIGKTIADKDGSPVIDVKTATKLITAHIGDAYGLDFDIGEFLTFEDLIGRYKVLKQEGILTYQTKKERTIGGDVTTWDVKLTEKGERETIVKALLKNGETVSILVGIYKVEKIVSISDDNTVLFVNAFEPNEFGRKVSLKGAKGRGKAKFKYDLFLEKFVFKGWMYSHFEKEDWVERIWVDEVDGKRIIMQTPAAS